MLLSRLNSLLVIGLALGGIGVSAYLTTVHYAHVELVCTSNGIINCEQVLKSSYSTVLGVPWSVGGIAWFAVSGALAGAALLRRPEPPLLQPLQVAWSLLGLAVVIYLVGVEFIALDHVCLWCTSMHVLVVLTLLLTLLRTPPDEDEFPDRRREVPVD